MTVTASTCGSVRGDVYQQFSITPRSRSMKNASPVAVRGKPRAEIEIAYRGGKALRVVEP